MKIYQKVFFSIINDLDFLTGLDLNNSKNSGELLNWSISNFVNTLHDNKIYISEVTSTPINIQNENINLYLKISTKKLKTNKKVYICFYKNLDSIDELNFKKGTIFITESGGNEKALKSSTYFFKTKNGEKNLLILCN